MSIELSLYKLSDALQLKFTYEDGKVSGTHAGKFKTDFGLEIPLKIVAKKLFSEEQTGLLASVCGDLSIVVSHYPKTNMVSAYLLDGAVLFMDGVKAPPELFFSKKNSLREVMQALGHAVVASFYYKEGWKVLKMP